MEMSTFQSKWQELSEDDGTPVLSQPIALVISSFKVVTITLDKL